MNSEERKHAKKYVTIKMNMKCPYGDHEVEQDMRVMQVNENIQCTCGNLVKPLLLEAMKKDNEKLVKG